MQRLLPILMSSALLAAACSSSTLHTPNKDAGDATAKEPPGTGGISGSQPDAVATGGIAGTGQDALGSGGGTELGQGGLVVGTGGVVPGTGGSVGTGGAATATSATSGTGGVVPGTGGSIGTGGVGNGGGAGSGGSFAGSCPLGKCAMDAGALDADRDAPSPDVDGPASVDAPAIEDAPSSMSCTWDDKVYPDQTTWWWRGCNDQICDNGRVFVTTVLCLGDASRENEYACTFDGKSFEVGITFPSTDGCNLCECMAMPWYLDFIWVSEAACTMRDCSTTTVPDALPAIDAEVDGCLYDGKLYPLDTYFRSADGCDDCHCRGDGQIACTLSHRVCNRKYDASTY